MKNESNTKYKVVAYTRTEGNEQSEFFSVVRIEEYKGKVTRLVPVANHNVMEDAFKDCRDKNILARSGNSLDFENVLQAIKQSNEYILANIAEIKRYYKKGKLNKKVKGLFDESFFNKWRVSHEEQQQRLIDSMNESLKMVKPVKKRARID